MKTTLLVLSVVCVLFSVLTNVASLQCYSCHNCTKVKEEYLITCGSNATSSTITPSTTIAPNATTTMAPNATTNMAPNATTTVAPDTSTTVAPNATIETPVINVSKVKREAEEIKDCVCQNDNCDCSGRYILQPRAEANATTINYVCVKDAVTVNGLSYVKRDCAVKYNQTKTTCTNASFMENCNICEKDKCNGSISLRFSTVTLFFSFLLYVF